ncbi:class I SAM-dependent methyltransferase [Brunnivagina elsteri]|uniref:SAM-dependent methyltransferase n=1 Tax=Brunnivagina elsteri CCALA 953 TaxID=987040 RepID=A0A2A2TBW2_9CYAN|nr:class I SAM-dependent methyltransferase [Calothrix elsteri]PAX51126.1 SAM-dependent methyltransferase [Calothrix elsteri CCALA 953]
MTQIFPGEVFANTTDFDNGIRQLIPRYDEMLEVIVRCLPSTTQRILELGCGTGELSLKVLQRFPEAKIIALDYSPRMINFAQEKISQAGCDRNWQGVEADFGEWTNNPAKFPIGDDFDACVSSLAIHHLPDEMKMSLFASIYKNLKHGGYFWNADPILAETPALAEVYQTAREEWTSRQGIAIADVRAKIGRSSTYGYSSQDQLATLETHLQMLSQAGFATVAVAWKYYGLAVFGGIRGGSRQ